MSHLLSLNQLINENYHELHPGILTKGYRNIESVYIEDNLFTLLRPAIKNGYEPFENFNCFEIPKVCWIQIVRGLEIIRESLQFQKTSELFEYIQPHFMLQTESFLSRYLENRNLIGDLIKDLIAWIEEQLINNEFITLIGL